jgi:iron complex transport system permease protein
LSATDVFQALAAHLGLSGISVEPTRLLVVGDIRLARVCLAILCGGCLAVAGVALQGVLRNPLADPFTLGVSAGAACGASLAIVFFGGAPALAHSLGLSHTGLIAAAALAGALAALFCAIWLGAGAEGGLERVVLAGIAVSAFWGLSLLWSRPCMRNPLDFWVIAGQRMGEPAHAVVHDFAGSAGGG